MIFRYPDTKGVTWAVNKEINSNPVALNLIKDIKSPHGDDISWADLIVLGATMALEKAGAVGLTAMFCSGRVDDTAGWDEFLEPRIVGAVQEDILKFRASANEYKLG